MTLLNIILVLATGLPLLRFAVMERLRDWKSMDVPVRQIVPKAPD